MKKDIIDMLSKVELHDLPVVRMLVLFEEKTVIIELQENINNEPIPLLIIFKEITNLFTNNPAGADFICESVLTLDCKAINNDKYECRLVIEMGHSKPVFVITIEFADLEIERKK